jgi:hypothetical protein
VHWLRSPVRAGEIDGVKGSLRSRTQSVAAIRSCTDLLKPGAPLLLYLYYAFDNRSRWFRMLWRLSNAARLLIRRLPPRPKHLVTDLIALTIYWPLSRLASRDRFGPPLEQRFSRAQIRQMCSTAALVDLRFSPRAPFWCVLGFKCSVSAG